MEKKRKKELQPLRALKNGTYKITFAWIDKGTLANIIGNHININIRLDLVDHYLHEYIHDRGKNLPKNCEEEEKMDFYFVLQYLVPRKKQDCDVPIKFYFHLSIFQYIYVLKQYPLY